MSVNSTPNKSHGSPYDRGSADAYYGRQPEPHKKIDGFRVILTNKQEIDEYLRGFFEEEDRKDWL